MFKKLFLEIKVVLENKDALIALCGYECVEEIFDLNGVFFFCLKGASFLVKYTVGETDAEKKEKAEQFHIREIISIKISILPISSALFLCGTTEDAFLPKLLSSAFSVNELKIEEADEIRGWDKEKEIKERSVLCFNEKELQGCSLSSHNLNRFSSFFNSIPVDIAEDSRANENAEEIYRDIDKITNVETGDDVQLVNAAFDRIVRHRDYDPRLVGGLKELYKRAIFLFDEKPDYDTSRAVGTLLKKKSNVGFFSNYGIKIRLDGLDYFVRYTTQNIKNRNDRITGRQFHSEQLSSTKISNLLISSSSILRAGRSVASDYKQASLFKIVNKYISFRNQCFGRESGRDIDNEDDSQMREKKDVETSLNKKINQPSLEYTWVAFGLYQTAESNEKNVRISVTQIKH